MDKSEKIIKELNDLKHDYNLIKEKYNKSISDLRNELKRIEEELAGEQFLTNALMNNLADYIYIKDRKSRFVRISKSTALAFGLDNPDLAIGKTDFDFFTNEHARQAFDDEQNIIRTGEKLCLEEKETHSDRPDTMVSTIKLPFRDKDGNIIGIFGISRDITEQKKLEEAFQLKQILLESIIENIPDQVYYKNRNSKFVLCNSPVALLAGCASEKDLIGKSDFDFYPHHLAQQYFDDEQMLMEKGEKFLDHEEQILNKNTGEFRWNLSSKVPVKDAEGNVIGLAGINRDITDRKRAEEEIILRNKQLLEINAEKDKFFSIIAHDLRSPLSAFLGATEILSEEIQFMTLEQIREIAVSMKISAANIYWLLENLLEWSKLKRGLMDFNPGMINVKEIVTASIDVLFESARKKKIKLNYALPDDLEIYADSHMFEAIVRNLVSNAIKFTPKSGEITVSVSAKSDNNIEINVSDTGIGMSRELITRLFQLNEKVNRNGTEGEPSTGLGLLLCKEFIEKHGGNIGVKSEVGKGSTFSLIIPSRLQNQPL